VLEPTKVTENVRNFMKTRHKYILQIKCRNSAHYVNNYFDEDLPHCQVCQSPPKSITGEIMLCGHFLQAVGVLMPKHGLHNKRNKSETVLKYYNYLVPFAISTHATLTTQ